MDQRNNPVSSCRVMLANHPPVAHNVGMEPSEPVPPLGPWGQRALRATQAIVATLPRAKAYLWPATGGVVCLLLFAGLMFEWGRHYGLPTSLGEMDETVAALPEPLASRSAEEWAKLLGSTQWGPVTRETPLDDERVWRFVYHSDASRVMIHRRGGRAVSILFLQNTVERPSEAHLDSAYRIGDHIKNCGLGDWPQWRRLGIHDWFVTPELLWLIEYNNGTHAIRFFPRPPV